MATLESVFCAVKHLKRQYRECKVEIICVDDGSTDNTLRILNGYKDSFANSSIDYIVLHQKNSGVSAARNNALSTANGDWIVFIDGDDLVTEDFFSAAAKWLMRDDAPDILNFRFETFIEGNCSTSVGVNDSISEVCISNQLPSWILFRTAMVPTFFSRRIIAGIRFPELILGEDRLFVLRALLKKPTVLIANKVIYRYRIRNGSAMHSILTPRKCLDQLHYAFDSLRLLSESGCEIGRRYKSHLTTVLLSEVPSRIAHLKKSEQPVLWHEWKKSLLKTPTSIIDAKNFGSSDS